MVLEAVTKMLMPFLCPFYCDGQDQREANIINVRQGDDPQILNNNSSSLTILPNKSSVETRKAQLMDPIIGPVLQWKEDSEQRPLWSEVSYQSPELKTYLGFWNQLRMLNGILYKKILNKPPTCWQLVVPEWFKEEILHTAHDNATAGHLGIERTLPRLKCKFYWPGMADDVTIFCRKCETCQLRKGHKKNIRSPMVKYLVGAPMERIGIDILGPLPESASGNCYILVVCVKIQ